MQDWQRELRRLGRQLKKSPPGAKTRRPNPRVRVLWEAVHEYVKLHYAHNRFAKPIRY